MRQNPTGPEDAPETRLELLTPRGNIMSEQSRVNVSGATTPPKTQQNYRVKIDLKNQLES